MKILLTGSAGFIGRHMLAALPDDDVTCVDIADGIDCIDFFRLDRTRFDLAIHCAATVGGRATIDGSPLAVATNLALDSLYFRWLTQTKTPRAVYFSSSAAYPISLQARGRHHQLTETDIDIMAPATPDATYGFAKLTGERLAAEAQAAGVSIVIPRPFSGYGEDQDLTYPFPSFIGRALRREDPFTIWGDGTQVRDFIHVDDVVAATLSLVNEGFAGPINIGSGFGTSFNELARMVCVAAGYEPAIHHISTAPTGVWHRVADTALLAEHYIPQVGLLDAVEHALTAVPV